MTDASDELEREAERVRAQLAGTAEELRARVSPGQIVDDLMTALRDGGANDMLETLKAQMRANPMAIAMIGGGLAWLMLGRTETADRSSNGYFDPLTGDHPYPRRGRPGYYDNDGHEKGVTLVAAGAGHGADGTTDRVVGALHDVAAAAGHQMHEAADTLRHGARDAMEGLRHGRHRARSAVSHALDREPLLIGAMGFAAGAVVGAMLPATEIERRNLAPASEALQDTAGALVDDGVALARDVLTQRRGASDTGEAPEPPQA
jgi:hypothetical protein